MSPIRSGVLFALGAYLLWGFLPAYWKALSHVPPGQVLAHRIIWSCLFLAVLVLAGGRRNRLREAWGDRRAVLGIVAAALLISSNWLVFIWAVGNGHIVESSLGYFINPLLNVALGVLLLRERLRAVQWLPLALAALGVLHLSFSQGRPPWIALSLAITFCLYSLVKKTTRLDSITGMSLETGLLLLPALAWAFLQPAAGPPRDAHTWLLLAGAGPITAVPLLLFAAGARRIPLWLTGLLQYLAPTLQFLLGILWFHEPLGAGRLTGFLLVWSGLAIFAAESIWRARRQPPPAAA